MRIVLLITGLGIGGAERQVVDLADAFVADGHDVLLACLGGAVLLRPADPRVQVLSLGMTRTPVGLWRAVAGLRRLIESFKPEVVHTHLVHANLLARLLRLFVDMPVLISSAHNPDEEGWWRMVGYRLTDHWADLSTNVSAEAVKAFERRWAVPPGKMRVVYNGIAVDKFRFDAEARARIRADLAVGDNHKLLLAVGRLCPPKDYPNLLQALALLHRRNHQPAFTLAVAGDGPLLGTLQSQARGLGLGEEEVIFLGTRHDVTGLMSAADVFVLPSAWEGFGLVVAEAMACERPVVATDCGGVREVLGGCGWLVPPRDPAALAERLADLLRLARDDAARVGRDARQRIVAEYSIEAAVRHWLAIYAEFHGRPVRRVRGTG